MLHVNIIVDAYDIVICSILTIYLLLDGRYRVRFNRLFVYMCLSNIAMTFGDMLYWIFQGNTLSFGPAMLHIGTFIYFACAAPLMFTFVVYFIDFFSERIKLHKAFFIIALVVTALHFALIVWSEFNDMFYYFDENNVYVRGKFFIISQLFSFCLYTVGLVLVFKYRSTQRKQDFIRLLTYISLPAISQITQILHYGISLLNTSITITLLLIFVHIQSNRELLIKEQEAELTESRIDIMLSQIKPHFLYNALTTIRHLCDNDPTQAKAAITDFSHFLRGNMDSLTNKHPIPFLQELSHSQHYLRLEEQRFGSRLRVELDLQAKDFCVPPLSLQPLIENAVRHGILKREKGGTLTIRTGESENAYTVSVVDDGVGFKPETPPLGTEAHIGILNVRARLKTMCRGTLAISSIPGEGTVATMRIPKEGGACEISRG